MDTPNPELMHLYGTDAHYLEKTGQMPGLVRAVAGVAGFGLYKSDQQHQEELLAEAELMNQQLRMVEAAKMQGVVAGFKGQAAPVQSMPLPPVSTLGLMKGGSVLNPEAEKVASAFGRSYAQGIYKRAMAEEDEETLELLEKVANGQALTELEKAAFFGKLMGWAGRGLGKAVSGIGGTAAKFGGKTGATGARRSIGQAGMGVEQAGLKLTQKATPVVGKAQQATQTIAKAPHKALPPGTYRQTPASVKAPPAQPSVVIKDPKAKVTTGQRPAATQPAPQPKTGVSQPQQVRGAPAPAPKPAPTPAATAATPPTATPMPGTETVAQMKAKSDPWLSFRTKAKIGLGLTAAGVGYAGYKGLQTARDVMLQPSMTGGQWGGYRAPMRHSINQYGY